jgi:hypothetical protein
VHQHRRAAFGGFSCPLKFALVAAYLPKTALRLVSVKAFSRGGGLKRARTAIVCGAPLLAWDKLLKGTLMHQQKQNFTSCIAA